MTDVTDKEKPLGEKLDGRARKLFDIWSEYYDMSVFKNDHLEEGMFLFATSAYLTQHNVRYLYQGTYKTTRINPFALQESGSGKSEAMKTTDFLMRRLGLKGAYLNSATDAGLVGTISPSKGKAPWITYGVLKDHDYLFWDEGTSLFHENNHSKNLLNTLQQATDEGTSLHKVMAAGTLSYCTNTAICASSYFDRTIGLNIYERGIFQRMLLLQHQVRDEELIEYMEHKHEFASVDSKERSELQERFKFELEQINYRKLGQGGDNVHYVKFNLDDLKTCNQKVIDFIKKGSKAYKKEKRHDILRSFMARNDLILKVAALIATLNDESEVGLEELDIGRIIWQKHILSANDILFREYKPVVEENEQKKILAQIKALLVKRQVPIMKLRDELVALDSWPYGESNTYKILRECISSGDLKTTKSGKEVLVFGF